MSFDWREILGDDATDDDATEDGNDYEHNDDLDPPEFEVVDEANDVPACSDEQSVFVANAAEVPSASNEPPLEPPVAHTPRSPVLIDIAGLLVDQELEQVTFVDPRKRTIAVRKPHRQEFVRVHPKYLLGLWLVYLKEDKEWYLVDRTMASSLATDLVHVNLRLAINAQGSLFIWPVRQAHADGTLDRYGRSHQDAARDAMTRWVQVVADQKNGVYIIKSAAGPLAEPKWPSETFEELFSIAFRNHHIRDDDHPVVRRLRGRL